MRKIVAIALLVLMLLSVASVGAFTVSAENSTDLPANARPIENGEDFMSMQSGGSYYLTGDITIDFSYTKTFTGFFDGQGYTVTTEFPLFTNLNGATVRNVTIAGEIDDTDLENVYVGALANNAGDSRIENVHNTADVIGSEKAYVGGIIGFNRGASDLYIANCSNSGTLYGQGCGGIIADCDGENVEIINCRNSGEFECIRKSSNAGFGGIVASAGNNNGIVSIDGCINTANIVGRRPGGIVGVTNIRTLVVSNCINTGNVTSTTNYAAGIACNPISMTPAIFRNCVNTGTVQAHKSYAAGIAAYASKSDTGRDGSCSFYGCVNLGTIMLENYETAESGCNLGGIAGKLNGRSEFYNCVSAGKLYNSGYIGGLVAKTGAESKLGEHIVSGCYVAGEIYTSTSALTSATSYGLGSLISYSYGAVIATDNVIAVNMKSEYAYEEVSRKEYIMGCVAYSNSGSGIYQNIHDVSTYTAGSSVRKVILLNARDKDLTVDIGNNISNIYSSNDYPIYWSIVNGYSANKAKPVKKADYTNEKIVEILNEGLGYEAYTIITDKSSNEFGISGILPTSVVEFLTASVAEDAKPVGTAEEFLAMEASGNYYLTANITLPTAYSGVFRGTLDGKGHTLTVSNSVFEVISSATISNLTIKGSVKSTAEAVMRSADDYRGALAFVGVTSTVTKVTNEANVSAYNTAGGILGLMQGGSLTDCINKGTITASAQIGGLVGLSKNETARFEGCVNEGTLKKNLAAAGYIGGILANSTYADAYFDACVNNAPINLNAPNSKVGGILGHANAPIYTTEIINGVEDTNEQKLLVCTVVMTDCINNGKITAYDYAAGILAHGEVVVDLTNCVNNADIQSTQNFAAGIAASVGTVHQNPEVEHTINNCVNNGNITSHRQYVSGIVSYCADSISFKSCVNNGDVTGQDISFSARCKDYKPAACHSGSNYRFIVAGGILGRGLLDARVEGCVNLGNVSGNHRVGGIAGEIGSGGVRGVIGKHSFLNCFVGGTIYNSNTYTVAGAEKRNGTGGLFGLAINTKGTTITVQYCGVTADITGVVSSSEGPHIVGGLGGFCNTTDAIYKDNYFTGVLSDGGSDLGMLVFLPYCDAALIRAANITGNFTSSTSIAYYNDARGLEYFPSEFENFVGINAAETGELCYRLYQSIGKDVFFQQLGEQDAPMPFQGEIKYMVRYDKTVPEYYNISRLSDEREDPDAVTSEDSTTEYNPPVTDPSDGTTEYNPPVTDPSDGTTEYNPPVTDSIDVTTAPETDEPDEGKGGCGSVVGASLAIVAVMLAVPAALVLKKRDEE